MRSQVVFIVLFSLWKVENVHLSLSLFGNCMVYAILVQVWMIELVIMNWFCLWRCFSNVYLCIFFQYFKILKYQPIKAKCQVLSVVQYLPSVSVGTCPVSYTGRLPDVDVVSSTSDSILVRNPFAFCSSSPLSLTLEYRLASSATWQRTRLGGLSTVPVEGLLAGHSYILRFVNLGSAGDVLLSSEHINATTSGKSIGYYHFALQVSCDTHSN